jgi:type IV pilus assembly protein PilC
MSEVRFRYEAVDATGGRRKGMINATDRDAARDALRAEGLAPTSIEASGKAGRTSGIGNVDIGDLLRGGKPKKWKTSKVAEFARQLHQLLRSGLSVGEALRAMADAFPDKDGELCALLSADVEAGTSLGASLARHPHAFNDVFVAYVETAEQSGTLVETTGRLAFMLEQRASLERKVQAVTIYPKLVSGIIGVIVLGVIIFMVPMYTDLYNQFDAEIAAPTRFVAWLSSVLSPIHVNWNLGFPPITRQSNHGWLTSPLNFASPLLWAILIVVAVRKFLAANRSNPKVAVPWNRFVFGFPIFGKLAFKMAAFRWASTMAGALKAGVRMPQALTLAGRATGSPWHALAATELADSVTAGRPLSELLIDYPDLFPPQVVAMVVTGERSGEMSEMLDSVAKSTTEDIDAHISTMGAKIEVALLVILGVVVGGLLAILYLPILQLVETIQRNLSRR